MDACHRADIKYVALLVVLGAAGVTGEVEGDSALKEAGVYLWAVVSACFVLALAFLVINCAKSNKKKYNNEGTIDAEENDPYVDPETWTADGPTDQPIMGQQHSSKKNKKNKRQSGASSELSSVTANHNHNQAVPITNYNQNISSHQPTITSAKDQEMDDLPHNVVDHRMNGWTTFVPTTDGSSYVPSEESSRRSSIANTVDEDADLKRLSLWSQSAAPRSAAPVPVTTAPATATTAPAPVTTAAPVPVTTAPATATTAPAPVTTAAPRTKAPAPVPVAAVARTTAPIPVIIEEHIPDLPPKTHKISETATPRSSIRSSKSKASSTKSFAASSSLSAYSDNNNNRKSAAEENQDKTLAELGLYRYKIIGDGNCLFRAVASQLRVPQARFHLLLRKAAAMWMKEHKDELMDQGLLENDDELWATEKEGQWPGHAAIVALANLLKVNIAVIQGGEKGEIDIEHIEPAEGHVHDGDEHGSLILSYMFNGHYDAVVDTPDLDNPEYTAWCQRRGADDFASETLARKLQAEEDAKAKRMTQAEYDDFRLARALAEEERQAAMEERERLVAMQAKQAGANGVKLALLEHRASAHVGVNQTVTGYDTIDETKINDKKKNAETTSNASSEYEKLTELSTPVKPSEEGERKHPVFGRQRSLSLTPAATGSSMKMSLSPQKMFSRTRSQSLSESQYEKSLKEYTEDDIKKFLKPLSTMQARKKFAYLDLIV